MNEIQNQIQIKFESILSNSNIPKEITFDNVKVLKINKFKKHSSIYFMDTKLMFRIVENKKVIIWSLGKNTNTVCLRIGK